MLFFFFLSTFPFSILSPPKLVFIVFGRSRLDDILQVLDVKGIFITIETLIWVFFISIALITNVIIQVCKAARVLTISYDVITVIIEVIL